MDMEQYRIKEEAKKYINADEFVVTQTKDKWRAEGINEDALELADAKKPKVKVTIPTQWSGVIPEGDVVFSINRLVTLDRKQLIEFCVEEFGSLQRLSDLVEEYEMTSSDTNNFIEFVEWRKTNTGREIRFDEKIKLMCKCTEPTEVGGGTCMSCGERSE